MSRPAAIEVPVSAVRLAGTAGMEQLALHTSADHKVDAWCVGDPQVIGVSSMVSQGQVVPVVAVTDIVTGEAVIDETPPIIKLRGEASMAICLPAKEQVYVEPGWTAVDAVDGDVSQRVHAKLVNSSAPITASGALNFSALEPTAQGRPYIIRCVPCLTFPTLPGRSTTHLRWSVCSSRSG